MAGGHVAAVSFTKRGGPAQPSRGRTALEHDLGRLDEAAPLLEAAIHLRKTVDHAALTRPAEPAGSAGRGFQDLA
jgi:hypothetical protein